ncbi:MAG: hypothetical protein JO366_17900, partial [Methylobacteriaceae bacterium]|nr:hypothetical protein [Methylobacteriaceae bacterium]MBV9246674.1 hypothetical protein [Methylobacteriaceae bacterium]
MASQSKAPDPAAAALSAIEEALRLANAPNEYEVAAGEQIVEDDAHQPVFDARGSTPAASGNGALRLPDVNDSNHLLAPPEEQTPFVAPPRQPPAAKPRRPRIEAQVAPPSLPANDDRRNVDDVLQSLNTKPSHTPYLLAVVATVGWIGICAAYAYANWSPPPSLSLKDILAQPEVLLGAVLAVAPVFLFFVIAALARRVQEIRLS